MLQTGSLNFRPPVSRSRSAPRLGSIDEEEEEEEFGSDVDSVCYREAPDGASTASYCGSDTSPTGSTDDTGSITVPESAPSSVCCDDDMRRRRRTEADSMSDESGYHEDKLCRELSEELFYSDGELVIVEEDYDDDEHDELEQVTAL